MSISQLFTGLLNNLRVDNSENISLKYNQITKSLNKRFRDTESETQNSLRVGSYGRYRGLADKREKLSKNAPNPMNN